MIMCYRIFHAQRSSVDAPNVVESIERSANAGLVQSMKNMGTSSLALLVLEFNYYCLICHFICIDPKIQGRYLSQAGQKT